MTVKERGIPLIYTKPDEGEKTDTLKYIFSAYGGNPKRNAITWNHINYCYYFSVDHKISEASSLFFDDLKPIL